jgi:hypothetical protein
VVRKSFHGTLSSQPAQGCLFDAPRTSSQYLLSVCTAYELITLGATRVTLHTALFGPLIALGAAVEGGAIQAAASCCANWVANGPRSSPFGVCEELHMERYPGGRFPCFLGQGGGHTTAP